MAGNSWLSLGGGGGMSEGDDRDTSSCAGRKGLNLKAGIGGCRRLAPATSETRVY